MSELEPLAAATSSLQNPWDADMVAYVNHKINSGELTLVPMHGLQKPTRSSRRTRCGQYSTRCAPAF